MQRTPPTTCIEVMYRVPHPYPSGPPLYSRLDLILTLELRGSIRGTAPTTPPAILVTVRLGTGSACRCVQLILLAALLSFDRDILTYIVHISPSISVLTLSGPPNANHHLQISPRRSSPHTTMGQNDGQRPKPSMDQPMFGLIPVKDSNSQTAFQGHMIAASGEFVGTFLFLLFAFLGHSMAVDTAPNSGPNGVNSNQTVIYIAMSYGFSLLVTVWTLFRISGGLFNPAVTLAMVVTGSVPPVRGLILFPVQIISGICAAAVAAVIIPGDIRVVQTTLTPGMSPAQGVFLEMVRRRTLMTDGRGNAPADQSGTHSS